MRSANGAPVTLEQRRARPLLAFRHPHEVTRRLHIEVLALVVADHRRFLPARCAGALATGNDAGDSRQTLRQRLAPWMRLGFPHRCARQHLPARLCFHFVTCCAGLFLGQQSQLQAAQRFALRTQLLDSRLAQEFFQRLNFQLRPVQLSLQFSDARGSVHKGEALYYAST